MIKIPGTEAGLPAITRCIADGISVNVTLLFSVERYAEVIEACFPGWSERLDRGLPLEPVASVASFFVSRVDGRVDPLLDRAGAERALAAPGPDRHRQRRRRLPRSSSGPSARPRWDRLAKAGARPQRPLWASTSTKDPRYPDTYYVEALVAPQHREHPSSGDLRGLSRPRPARGPDPRGDRGRRRPSSQALATAGIDLAAITRELEEDGVAKFAASYAVVALRDRGQERASWSAP